MKKLFNLLLLLVLLSSCNNKNDKQSEEHFRFVFMTDIHLQPERNAMNGFQAAIDKVNQINPDFVITGGDLIMDALAATHSRADSLYSIYDSMSQGFAMPVYNTMGNHEVYGTYQKGQRDSLNPDFEERMFENRIGKRYYSFDHKGWHFMILDAIEQPGRYYIGGIDDQQMDWIKTDLATLDPTVPIVISVHIPFITAQTQMLNGSTAASEDSWVITNSKEVLALFDHKNLKLVLQGHLHILEDIFIFDKHFITGGAVSAAWWTGPYFGTEEGFLQIDIKGNDFSWKYIDYGWEIKPRIKFD
jgi:3',5'-cyclic-AMP phosphodiesterase